MVTGRLDEEISILRSWKRMSGGYDEISMRVNESIAELGDDAPPTFLPRRKAEGALERKDK